MKRFISFALVSILSFSILSATVSSAAELENLSDFDYSKFNGQDITLNVANWGEYMSVNDEDYLDVNKAFEELTGVEVNYKTYSTNEELYAKINGGGADYDIIIPSDYMISRMKDEGMLQKLNFDNIPNIKYIGDKYKNPNYDSANEYSVPYMWGIVCLIYNTTKVDGTIDSWNALWDEKYKNDILMFNNPRDAFGIALTKLGYSQNTTNEKEINEAADALKEQKPLVQAYVMDEIFDKMEGGSAAIAPYYAGDAVTMIADNPDLTYAIPKEGTNRFVDAMCIPTVAKNKEVAEMYINFLCETDIALTNADYVGYSTPQTEAYNLLDDEVKNSPLQYPDETYLSEKTEYFENLPDETNKLQQKLWNELKIDQKTSVLFIPLLLISAVLLIVLISAYRINKKKKANIY